MNPLRAATPLTLALVLTACSPQTGQSDPAPTNASAATGNTSGPNPHLNPNPNLPPSPPPLDFKSLEAPLLTDHLQLTTRDMFVKAGEAYFDHNSPPRWIIFQAVPVPTPGVEADPFYAMYVAKLKYDRSGIIGIDTPIRISPEGSANTCGWFDPVTKHRVIFGSTLTRPGNTRRPGFQVGTRNYIWMFPHEMEVVSRTLPEVFRDLQPNSPQPAWSGDAFTAKPVFTLPNYDAECSYSNDGRFILYARVRNEPTRGKDDADIWIYDTQTARHHELVHADGYDGGPFFSPDNKRICYRSDRVGNNLLQLFIADLKFDSGGVPIGIEREHQITNNQHVNWAPYWHPSGQFLLYSTSEMGHTNYEVFAVEVPCHDFAVPPQSRAAAQGSSDSPTPLRHRRITHASGADVLPVFSDNGNYMMWTAQRGKLAEGESKPSSQVWVAKFDPIGLEFFASPPGILSRKQAVERITTFLRAKESETKAKVQAAGGSCSPFDLGRMKIDRIREGWRGSVNVWNVPDGGQYIFALDDGRMLDISAHAPLQDDETRDLYFSPALPDPK